MLISPMYRYGRGCIEQWTTLQGKGSRYLVRITVAGTSGQHQLYNIAARASKWLECVAYAEKIPVHSMPNKYLLFHSLPLKKYRLKVALPYSTWSSPSYLSASPTLADSYRCKRLGHCRGIADLLLHSWLSEQHKQPKKLDQLFKQPHQTSFININLWFGPFSQFCLVSWSPATQLNQESLNSSFVLTVKKFPSMPNLFSIFSCHRGPEIMYQPAQ